MTIPALTPRLYATIAMAVVGLLFFTNWATYQYSVLGHVVPLVFYFGSMAFAVVLIWLCPKSLASLFREPLFYWFFLYAVSGLIWVAFGGDLVADGRDWRVRFLLFFLFSTGVVLSTMVDPRVFANILLLSAVFSAVTYWHDFLNPYFYVPQGAPGSNPGRGAGLFINANQAGNALIALIIAAMPFIGKQWRAFLLVVLLLGVVPTFSRSSILFVILAAGVWIWSGYFRRWNLVFLLVAMPLAAVSGYQLFNTGIVSSEVNLENIMNRIAFFTELGETLNFSANERQYVAELGWNKFSNHPLTGIGVGATDLAASPWGYEQSTHNMFLRLLVEQGVLGGLLYLSLVALILVRAWRLLKYPPSPMAGDIGLALLLVVLYFTFLGLFSHTLLQEPVGVLTLAFLVTLARRVEREAQRSGHFLTRNPLRVSGG